MNPWILRTKSSTRSIDGERLDDGADGPTGDNDDILEVEAEDGVERRGGGVKYVKWNVEGKLEGKAHPLAPSAPCLSSASTHLSLMRQTRLAQERRWRYQQEAEIGKGVEQTYKGFPS